MPPRNARVLVDTNAIQAAHRYLCWNAIHKCFRLETAEHCIEEAVRPNRKGKRLVDKSREDLSKQVIVHAVADPERADLLHALQGRVDLDDGERDLLSFARTIKDEAWWLCGPDKATIRAMHLLGIMDKMCSLQALAEGAGARVPTLEDYLTDKWLAAIRTQLLLTGNLN